MALVWTDNLAVGVEMMDADHQTLLLMLAQMAEEPDEKFVTLFNDVAHHLEEHFGRENELMRRYDFFAYHCHRSEHDSVLAWVRSLAAKAAAGDLAESRRFISSEIEPWFIEHRNTMDLVTARFVAGALQTQD